MIEDILPGRGQGNAKGHGHPSAEKGASYRCLSGAEHDPVVDMPLGRDACRRPQRNPQIDPGKGTGCVVLSCSFLLAFPPAVPPVRAGRICQ